MLHMNQTAGRKTSLTNLTLLHVCRYSLSHLQFSESSLTCLGQAIEHIESRMSTLSAQDAEELASLVSAHHTLTKHVRTVYLM